MTNPTEQRIPQLTSDDVAGRGTVRARQLRLVPDDPGELPDDEAARLAQETWRVSAAEGIPILGKDLGPLYGRSPRWGQKQAQLARQVRPEGEEKPPVPNSPATRQPTAVPAAAEPSRLPPPVTQPIQRTEPDVPAASAPRTTAHRPPPNHPGIEAQGPTTTGTSPMVQRITAAAVIVVAGVAAAASYEHMRHLAGLAGEGWRSWLLPLSVDGMMVAASMTMLTRRRAGEPAGLIAWVSLVLGGLTSLAANVVAADPTLVDPALIRRLVAAWPPVALLLAYELLLQQLRRPAAGSQPATQ